MTIVTEALITEVTARNVERQTWLDEGAALGEQRWVGMYSTDPAHYAEREIFTVEDLNRNEILDTLYDMHRDAYNYRPDMSYYNALPYEQLVAEVAKIGEDLEREIAAEKERAQAREDRFLAALQEIMDVVQGADLARAFQIKLEADGYADEQDRGYIEYCYGLEYGALKRIFGE